ncbi:MAG: hypothetical protein ACRD0N_12030, partial [Acidimicrobiales bacterium]
APGGAAAPAPGGALPVPGGAPAGHPGVAGIREDAPDAAPLPGYHMVRADAGEGPAGWPVVSAGIAALLACGMGGIASRRARARTEAGCQIAKEAC